MLQGVTVSRLFETRSPSGPEPPSTSAPITRITVSTIWITKNATTANRMPTSGFHQA